MEHAALCACRFVSRSFAITIVVLMGTFIVMPMGMTLHVGNCVIGGETACNGLRCNMRMHAAKRKQYKGEQDESGQSTSQYRQRRFYLNAAHSGCLRRAASWSIHSGRLQATHLG